MKRPRGPSLFDDERSSDESESRETSRRRRCATGAVGPAVPDAGLVELAAVLPPGLRLGTSSWSFPGWAGIVYDRPAKATDLSRDGLAAYARHPLLRCVCVDRTYYAPLDPSSFAEYAARVPNDFRFVVKAPAACTDPHLRDAKGKPVGPNPTFLDATWVSSRVIEPLVVGLGATAGPLVFQFPPVGREIASAPGRFAEALWSFFSALPPGPAFVVELRDSELLGAGYIEMLRRTRTGHVVNVHPRMPSPSAQARIVGPMMDTGPLVVRWMLRSGLGYEGARERYAPFDRLVDEDPATRDEIARLCRDRARAGGESFVVANNKAEGCAPLSLFRLAARIAEPSSDK